MTPAECAELLGTIASFDPKAPQPSRETAKAWASLLHDVDLEDAAAVATEHYRRTRDTIAPSDIQAGVRAARQDSALRQSTTERVDARRGIADATAKALERGMTGGHIGVQAMDTIYAEQAWSPTARAAAAHTCPWCREPAGLPCTRPSGRHDTHREDCRDPHPSRVALTVACVECAAEPGATCPAGEHPHHHRELDAIGSAGQTRRRELTAALRAAATDVDWQRAGDFVSPDPEQEPPPDPWDDVPEPRGAKHDQPAEREA